MFAIYEYIVTHPIFWVFVIMTLAVFAIQSTVAMKIPSPKVDKRWLRQNYVMLILLVATTLAVSATVFYLFEIGVSVAGLVNILRDSVNDPTTKPEDFRNLGTAVALLMGVLAASATIFFSIIRVWMNERTASAAEEALFNDKINAAVSDLHAQRQVTKWLRTGAQNGWEDDVTRRNGAIDRLLGLANEEEQSAPRIARMLSVYVKELSREYPAKTPPKSDDPKVLQEWADKLTFARSDMQNAVQVLGKLRKESGLALQDGEIDLSETNLQGFDLSGLNLEKVSFSKAQLQGAYLRRAQLQGAKLSFAKLQGAKLSFAKLQGAYLSNAQLQGAHLINAKLQGANLAFAQLQGAYLSNAQLQGAYLINAQLQGANLRGAKLQGAYLSSAKLQGANLRGAKLQGADLRNAEFDAETTLSAARFSYAALRATDFSETSITQEQLDSAFGDASVTLPGGKGIDDPEWPALWSKERLDYVDFDTQWRAFQAKNGYDPDAP
jgi:uncharacterized protein YjbI with pentapeptide repeats